MNAGSGSTLTKHGGTDLTAPIPKRRRQQTTRSKNSNSGGGKKPAADDEDVNSLFWLVEARAPPPIHPTPRPCFFRLSREFIPRTLPRAHFQSFRRFFLLLRDQDTDEGGGGIDIVGWPVCVGVRPHARHPTSRMRRPRSFDSIAAAPIVVRVGAEPPARPAPVLFSCVNRVWHFARLSPVGLLVQQQYRNFLAG